MNVCNLLILSCACVVSAAIVESRDEMFPAPPQQVAQQQGQGYGYNVNAQGMTGWQNQQATAAHAMQNAQQADAYGRPALVRTEAISDQAWQQQEQQQQTSYSAGSIPNAELTDSVLHGNQGSIDSGYVPQTPEQKVAASSSANHAPPPQAPPLQTNPYVQQPPPPAPYGYRARMGATSSPGLECTIPMWSKTEYVCKDTKGAREWEDTDGLKRLNMDEGDDCAVVCPGNPYWMTPNVETMTCKKSRWSSNGERVKDIKCETARFMYGFLLIFLVGAAAMVYHFYNKRQKAAERLATAQYETDFAHTDQHHPPAEEHAADGAPGQAQ